MIKEYVLKPLAFVIIIPVLLILLLLGFISSWQCGKMNHLFNMKKYHLQLIDKKEFVCKSCHEVLTERR